MPAKQQWRKIRPAIYGYCQRGYGNGISVPTMTFGGGAVLVSEVHGVVVEEGITAPGIVLSSSPEGTDVGEHTREDLKGAPIYALDPKMVLLFCNKESVDVLMAKLQLVRDALGD